MMNLTKLVENEGYCWALYPDKLDDRYIGRMIYARWERNSSGRNVVVESVASPTWIRKNLPGMSDYHSHSAWEETVFAAKEFYGPVIKMALTAGGESE